MNGLDRTVDQELFIAAEQGNFSETERLLSLGADVLARNDRHTALHSAVLSDNENVVKLFLNKIIETQENATPYIDAKNTEGDTPLMLTAAGKNDKIARILLEYGADVEVINNDGMTALHWVAKKNNIEVMNLLICRGANVYVKDNHGRKPLDFAIEEGHKKVAGYLTFIDAEILKKQGKYKEALEAYQKAVSIQEVVLEPDHPVILMTRHNMAEVLSNQGKYSEALEIYQKVYDIQKRKDVLGHDHPHTLKTLFNIAIDLSEQGKKIEVSKIFREILRIKGVKYYPDESNNLMTFYNTAKLLINQGNGNKVSRTFREMLKISTVKPQTDSLAIQTNSYIKMINSKKACIENNFSEKGDCKPKIYLDIFKEKTKENVHKLIDEILNASEREFSSVNSISRNHQELRKLDEEYMLNKCDELEAIKKDIDHYLQTECRNVYLVKGKDKGRDAWHYVLIDKSKREMFLEKSKMGSMDVADYGKVLYSGWGENPPKSMEDKMNFYFKNLSNDVFVIKENWEKMSLHHYVVIDSDKRKMFLEQSKKNFTLEKKIENCGKILHFGCGQDPPESISNKIINSYFDIYGENSEEAFANLSIEESKTLHKAVTNMEKEVLRGFVKESKVDKNGWTPLHHAAFVGNIQTVEYLISCGVDLKVRDDICCRMPLHIAAREGHKDVVKLFLEKSSDVYDVDGNKWTALHYSTWSGHLEIVKLLIHQGFDIHEREGTHGKKPIHIAARNGYMNLVMFFLSNGGSIDDTDSEGRSSLYYAAWGGHLELVKYLAGRGANIHAKNIYGNKPMHIASSDGYINIIEFLLDRGANVNDCSNDNYTPLHRAAEDGRLEVTKFLLKKGANSDIKNSEGKTPSDLAKKYGHTNIATILDCLTDKEKAK